MKYSLAFLLLAVGCTHSKGYLETKTAEIDAGNFVHIHDSLNEGDLLSVVKQTCTTKFGANERPKGSIRTCESKYVGCAKILEKRSEDSYLIQPEASVQLNSELLFERFNGNADCKL